MHLPGRSEARLAAAILIAVLAGCVSSPPPVVESARLTDTDLDVLRVTLKSVIAPLLVGERTQVALSTATLVIPLVEPTPHSAPALRRAPPALPPPPPEFSDASFAVPDGGSRNPMIAEELRRLLTSDERAIWPLRNRASQEIPELGVARLVVGRRSGPSDVEPVVAVSSPSYPTSNAAVVYVEYECGGLCGEGLLIRLKRAGPSWEVVASLNIWIR